MPIAMVALRASVIAEPRAGIIGANLDASGAVAGTAVDKGVCGGLAVRLSGSRRMGMVLTRWRRSYTVRRAFIICFLQ